jgi:protein TorT
MRKLILASASAMLLCGMAPAHAGDKWTYPVLVREPSLLPTTDKSAKATKATYESLDSSDVSKKWHICVAMPNMDDPYYVAMNYGANQEAKRLGVQMTMASAGGYENLTTQINQIEDCVAQGANAILVMAISPTGLNQPIKEARSKGIAIVDLANGLDSLEIQARSKASWYSIGVALGDYMAARHPKGSGKTEILWLPGPAGAGWSEDVNRGFQESLKKADSDIVIAATQYGDTEKGAQIKLVEDGMATYPKLKYIVGSAQGADAGVQILREHGRDKDINLVSSWITPHLDELIRKGQVLAAVTDSVVMQTRIGMDQAVRILEKKPYVKDVEPEIITVDVNTVKTYDQSTSMAPAGWKVTFHAD